MKNIAQLANDFLTQQTIAVVGISSKKETVANGVLKKLKNSNRKVFAVGKNTEMFENEKCFPSLDSLPSAVNGVFVAANNENTEHTIKDCIALNIPRIWIHNAGGTMKISDISKTSGISPELFEECKTKNITLIPGSCPMMFVDTADLGHKCMKWVLSTLGKMKITE